MRQHPLFFLESLDRRIAKQAKFRGTSGTFLNSRNPKLVEIGILLHIGSGVLAPAGSFFTKKNAAARIINALRRVSRGRLYQHPLVYVCLLPDGKVVLLVVRDFLLGFTAPAGLSDTALSADFMPNCVFSPKRLPKDDTLKRAEKLSLSISYKGLVNRKTCFDPINMHIRTFFLPEKRILP